VTHESEDDVLNGSWLYPQGQYLFLALLDGKFDSSQLETALAMPGFSIHFQIMTSCPRARRLLTNSPDAMNIISVSPTGYTLWLKGSDTPNESYKQRVKCFVYEKNLKERLKNLFSELCFVVSFALGGYLALVLSNGCER
jgi:hypothetical protein